MAKTKTKATPEEYEKLGRAIEGALIDDYINWLGNTRRQLWQGFLRGIVAGFGTVIGATLVVALVVWILHLFGGVPVVGDYLNATGNQIKPQ